MGVLVIPHLHALQQILILSGFAEGVCYYFGRVVGNGLNAFLAVILDAVDDPTHRIRTLSSKN